MKLRVLFLTLFIFVLTANAETLQTAVQQPTQPPITVAQNIAFENCTKMFNVNKEKLFYLTLGAITANKFEVDEIQTTNGYIIFTAAKNKYLATIGGIDSANSILKITPCNNIYFFQPGILINMYKYIDLNINTELK